MATHHDTTYWFRAKRHGIGWGLPLVWQGWVVLVVWIGLFYWGSRQLIHINPEAHWTFIAAMILVLIGVCYWKGEPLRLGRR